MFMLEDFSPDDAWPLPPLEGEGWDGGETYAMVALLPSLTLPTRGEGMNARNSRPR